MEKKGTSASPATARARRVLPVPGAPTRRTPLGMRPPSFWNFWGSFRNSMISLEFLFGLVDTGDVLERHLLGQPGEQLGPALPEGHGLVPPGLHLPHEKDPEEDEQDDREPAEEKGDPAVFGRVLDDDVDLVLAEDLDQFVILGRQDGLEGPAVLVFPPQLVVGDGHLFDVPLLHLVHELGEVDLLLDDVRGFWSRLQRRMMRIPAEIQKKTLRNDLFLFLGMTISFSSAFYHVSPPKGNGRGPALDGPRRLGDRPVAASRICSRGL